MSKSTIKVVEIDTNPAVKSERFTQRIVRI